MCLSFAIFSVIIILPGFYCISIYFKKKKKKFSQESEITDIVLSFLPGYSQIISEISKTFISLSTLKLHRIVFRHCARYVIKLLKLRVLIIFHVLPEFKIKHVEEREIRGTPKYFE